MIKVLATNVARKIGYNELKDLQLEVILAFVSGNDVFAFYPLVSVKVCVMHACQDFSIFYTSQGHINCHCCYATNSNNGRPGKWHNYVSMSTAWNYAL